MPPNTMQKVNSFALRAFRDTADKDYILARMAYRAALFPQFHWSSLHALEKYAKCILLLTRIPKPKEYIKHEVKRSLDLLSSRVDIPLTDQTKKFIERLEEFGARFRYLEVSWFTKGCELAILDRAVWELRRYCDAGLYVYSGDEFASVNPVNYEKVRLIDKPTHENTFILGGFIEKTLEDRKSWARPDLIWCNLYFSKSKRKSVLMRTNMMAENSPFYLHPEIIDEVSKYCHVPK